MTTKQDASVADAMVWESLPLDVRQAAARYLWSELRTTLLNTPHDEWDHILETIVQPHKD